MSSDSEGQQFVQHLAELFSQVDEEAFQRHVDGAKEYGPLGFLTNDTLEMLYEELLDGINYLRYTAVKVKLLQQALAEKAAPLEGAEGFVPTSKLLGKDFGDKE
jgi:hypothetical protein